MPGAILFSKVGEAAARFPDFVAELRSFLEGSGLVAGEADTAIRLAERVAEGGVFREDLASMLRVQYLQEPDTSYLQLLGLLLAAAVGEDEAESLAYAPQVEEPVRELFQFVVDARKGVPEEGDDAAEFEDEPAALTEEGIGLEAASEPTEFTEAPAVWGAVDPKDGRASMLARALAISADEVIAPVAKEAVPEKLVTEKPIREKTVAAVAATEAVPVFGQQLAGEEGSSRRVPSWAVACGGVLLGLLLGWFLHWQNGAMERAALVSAPVGAAGAPIAGEAVAGGKGDVREGRSGSGVRRAGEDSAELKTGGAEAPAARGRAAGGGRSGVAATNGGGHGTGSAGSATAAVVAPAASAGSAAAKAPKPVLGAMVPRVSAVDLNGTPASPSSAGTGAHLRMPSVVTGSSGIMAANLISAPAPAYPAQASAARVQGEVVIEAVVGRDGSVVDTRVVSGPELLRSAALSAVQRWQFRPYEVDGSPAEIATTARLEFRLPAE